MDKELIERLAMSAASEEERKGGEVGHSGGTFYIDMHDASGFVSRFASLIAEECCEIAREVAMDRDVFGWSAIADAIRERFKP